MFMKNASLDLWIRVTDGHERVWLAVKIIIYHKKSYKWSDPSRFSHFRWTPAA